MGQKNPQSGTGITKWGIKHTSLETSKKNQIGCGLGAKFGPNDVQCEKSEETGNIIGFFHIFLGEYILKQNLLVAKPPEWKFMVIMARNAKF